MKITPAHARSSPLLWGMYNYPKREGCSFWYKPYQYVKRMDRVYRRLLDPSDDLKRVIVAMPPRHGKSMFSSVITPSWAIGRDPDRRALVCGYGSDLPTKFSSQAKQMMEDKGGEVFGVSLNREERAKDQWGIQGRLGGMRGVGIGGGITGMGFQLIVVDDPYKNYQEAHSPAVQEHVWNEFQTTVETRLEPGGAVCVIATRWCTDDLSGRLIEQAKMGIEDWEIINLPALAVEDEFDDDGTLLRKAGEALCPDRYTKEHLEKIKGKLGAYKWNALYQQDPSIPDEVFWDSYLFDEVATDAIPHNVQHLVIGIDPAHGNDVERGCDSAVVACGTYDGNRVWVDSEIKRAGPSEIVNMIIELVERLPRHPDKIGIEDNALQDIILSSMAMPKLREKGIESELVGVTIDKDMRNKHDRIQSLDPAFRSRRFRFCRTPGCARLVQQAKYYGMAKQLVDGLDALEIATTLLEHELGDI